MQELDIASGHWTIFSLICESTVHDWSLTGQVVLTTEKRGEF